MKYTILLLIVCYLGLTNGIQSAITKSDLKRVIEVNSLSCKVPPDAQDIEDFIINNPDPRKTTKCLRHCLLTQFGMFENNKINIKKAADLFSDEYPEKRDIGEAIAMICNGEVNESDPCDAAHEFFLCGLREMKDRNMSIEAAL